MQGNQEFLLTKIIATLGPASNPEEMIRKLILEGARVFRINFSHGNLEEHETVFKRIRKASADTGIPVGIMGDLSGPKIRVGKVMDPGILLKPGMRVEFQKDDILTGPPDHPEGQTVIFSTTYPLFIDEVKPGEKVLLNDGNVLLTCRDKKKNRIICEVINGGLITSSKGVNLPDTYLSAPSLTEKDFMCVEFAVKMEFDFLALSFVRSAADVRLLKDYLKELGARPALPFYENDTQTKPSYRLDEYPKNIPVISKIEKPQAILELESILDESDGVMVARGDLGVEMDLAEVAVLQKRIISMCKNKGIPVIVATQMLESMISSPVPTRAEVSDVANAIFDGTDAVMLSGETAIGKYPVKAVRMMRRVAFKTNQYLAEISYDTASIRIPKRYPHRNAAIAHGVKNMVRDLDARCIVLWTQFGGEGVLISQQRIPRPVLAFSANKKSINQLSLLYGLQPEYLKQPDSGSKFIKAVDQILLERKWAEEGDTIIIAMGEPIDRAGVTNRLVVHIVGEES
ncbi:MAG: pyruvate kinase [Bacteroidota bacterium]|nr:pyruvate kinase [Bacteroidota bacterium]